MNEFYRVFKSHDITPIILDPNLSLSAKGLFIYLYHLPNGATFSIKNYDGVDSESTVRSAVNELMDKGYLERRELRDKNGKFVGLAYILQIPPTVIDITDDDDYRYRDLPTTDFTDDGNYRHRVLPTSGNLHAGESLDYQGIEQLDPDFESESFKEEKERKKEKEKEKEKVIQKEKEIEKEKERKKEKEELTISHDEKEKVSQSDKKESEIEQEAESEHRFHRFANERVYDAYKNFAGDEGLRGVEDTVVLLLQNIGFQRKSLRSKDDKEQIEEIINKCDGDISTFLRKLRLLVEQKDIRLMEYGGKIDLKKLRERWDDLTLEIEIPDMRGWNLTKLALYSMNKGYTNGEIVLLTKALIYQNQYPPKNGIYDIVRKVKEKMKELSLEMSKQKIKQDTQISNIINGIVKRIE